MKIFSQENILLKSISSFWAWKFNKRTNDILFYSKHLTHLIKKEFFFWWLKFLCSWLKKFNVKQNKKTYLNDENENNSQVVEKKIKFLCYFSNLGWNI
jgi:hypothetical protein